MEVKIDLSRDWIDYLRDEIAGAGYSLNPSDSAETLSYKFFNIRKRRVPALPRSVKEASTLSCPQEHQSGYVALKSKIVNGEDVTPHLSKKILSDNYEDALLNDWGIHHFHLGENLANGFAERTGPLLFALVTNSDVYCIDIKDHGAWSEQGLIRTLHEQWPESIAAYRIHGVLRLSREVSNEDIALLRREGIQTMVQVDEGVIYGPIGGGYSTAGTSVQSMMHADRYRRLVRDIERHVLENLESFLERIREHGMEPDNPPHFRLLVDENGFHVVESGSKVAFLIHPHGQG